MPTLLAKRAGAENPIATNDEHQQVMAADPSIPQFPSSGGFGGGFAQTSQFGGSTNIGTQVNQVQAAPMNLTAGGSNAAQGAEVLVEHDKESTDWINKKWRPALGWVYMITCITDFIIFPVLWSLLQALSKGSVTSQWQPLTLQGAGLFHLSMGACIGVAAYGRTKEKLAEKA